MRIVLAAAAMAATLATGASAQTATPERQAFRAIYEELVEIDTSMASGSCTRAANAMATHLREAGYPAGDVQVIVPEGHAEDGNVVAVLHGTTRGRAMLLLAHIDVVDARREDWERDPYTLVEENGFFYGRGSSDDKAMAAVFVDLMMRMKRENYRPRRDIRMALTCGEETSDRVNGVEYLLAHNRAWLQAQFALNEGAGGMLSDDGTRHVALNVQAGEKIHQVYTLTVTNPGGHSSRPRADNAIYQLAAGLERLAAYTFPVEINPVVRTYFQRMSGIVGGDTGAAMGAVGRNPNDAAALATVAADPSNNAIMRTTCVATRLDAGHAANALPQRAQATVSCRILQGHTPEEVQAALQQAVADPGITVAIVNRRGGSQAPPLSRQIMGPIESVSARMWPSVPIVPTLTAGATDGRFLTTAGIPTYGVSGMFAVPGENNAHGLNEKIRVESLYEGRDFLDAIVRDYAMQR